MKELLESMNKIKAELEIVSKDGNNPYYNSTYTTLNAVYGVLENKIVENGLNLFQSVRYVEGGEKLLPYLKTVITHIETSQILSTSIPLVGIGNMQNLGSAITYARRYSLVTIFDIKQEDDDGNLSGVNPVVDIKKDPFDTDNFKITKKGGTAI